jgi:cyclic pyranopterin phosphate synthase
MTDAAGPPPAPAPRWPSVVEIEVNSRCNRRCSYCPNSQPDRPAAQNLMSRDLYERIIDQLAAIDFSGRLSFHFFNEPLLRKDLATLVAHARARLPHAYFGLYTNGDLLDDARYAILLAAGIDHFLVTRHSWDSFPERPFQFVQHPDNFALSGRGGTVAQAPAPLDLACFAPTEMMIVMVNGDVVLCHEDADRLNVMGNLARQSLSEVWRCDRFQALRRALERGAREQAAGICRLCDNRLHPIAGGAI